MITLAIIIAIAAAVLLRQWWLLRGYVTITWGGGCDRRERDDIR